MQSVLLIAAAGVLRLMLVPERWIIALLLGPGLLRERVRELEQSRAFAVRDSTEALRRIEPSTTVRRPSSWPWR